MTEPQFHHIDPESLKNISVEQITNQHNTELDHADYTIPVPTVDKTIPESPKDGVRYFATVYGVNLVPKNNPGSKYRGRIGGC